ncbi:hypothetical protein ACFL56_01675 [Candidatus Margulisiibacteriota bacterium]
MNDFRISSSSYNKNIETVPSLSQKTVQSLQPSIAPIQEESPLFTTPLPSIETRYGWIKYIILNYCNKNNVEFITHGGFDWNNDGTIEHFDIADPTEEDFYHYFLEHKHLIAQNIPFVQWGLSLPSDSIIHTLLFIESHISTPSVIEQTYTRLSDIFTQFYDSITSLQQLPPLPNIIIQTAWDTISHISMEATEFLSLGLSQDILDCDTSSIILYSLIEYYFIDLDPTSSDDLDNVSLVHIPRHMFLSWKQSDSLSYMFDRGVYHLPRYYSTGIYSLSEEELLYTDLSTLTEDDSFVFTYYTSESEIISYFYFLFRNYLTNYITQCFDHNDLDEALEVSDYLIAQFPDDLSFIALRGSISFVKAERALNPSASLSHSHRTFSTERYSNYVISQLVLRIESRDTLNELIELFECALEDLRISSEEEYLQTFHACENRLYALRARLDELE